MKDFSAAARIEIRGAQAHNLKSVDVSIPTNALVVFTGVSGSGKSSLAFNTIYAEGERRFASTLSAYARQFLNETDPPAVDEITGLSPTLSIDQQGANRNPRSTVGTVTELYDHLRLLMARLGVPHCPACGHTIEASSTTSVAMSLLKHKDGLRVELLAPIIIDKKGEHRKLMQTLAGDGWVRAVVNGEPVRLTEPPSLARYEKHTIEVVVDRLVLKQADHARLVEAIEVASRLSKGTVVAVIDGVRTPFSTDRACPHHPHYAIPNLEPRCFSFNAPQGACPTCDGIGTIARFDPDKLFDHTRSPIEGFRGFNDAGKMAFVRFTRTHLEDIVKRLGVNPTLPLQDWPKDAKEKLLHGDAGITWNSGRKNRPFRGLVGLMARIWHFTKHKPYEVYRIVSDCSDCNNERLNAISRAVTFHGTRLPTLVSLPIVDLHHFFGTVKLRAQEKEIGQALLHEIRARLSFLVEVGLGYLTLDRKAGTLSGGESQRIRLAAAVGSPLRGVTYVLDEPSIGLHARDNKKLLHALQRLRDRGNTVIVVEHDEDTIIAADHVVEVGPGAGQHGGQVVVSTTGGRFAKSDCATARYIRRERVIPMRSKVRNRKGEIQLHGAVTNNLQSLNVTLPLGQLVVVTGVSGSGKSSLIFGTLVPAISAWSRGDALPIEKLSGVQGFEQIDRLVTVDQQPIGRTPRSNPATYTGIMDHIRGCFAATPLARQLGFTKSRFSFNVAGGRCAACDGGGVLRVQMQFLPDVLLKCEVCEGRRYNRETLQVTYGGLDIAAVLALSVGEAAIHFKNQPKIHKILQTLLDVGLDYLPLGQPSTTLSGGEAQRIKLARELHKASPGHALYILDEPTTGLHFQDVEMLLAALDRLVDLGHTVLVIEHHTEVIKRADHILDIGPDGGANGGQIVGQGHPSSIALLGTPTGRALSEMVEFGGKTNELRKPKRRVKRGKSDAIELRAGRLNNLNHVDLTIPHGKFNIVTGVSGSGKTSLAFGTIFSEGQRKYVECLSTYARRFLGRAERAPLESLTGLSPAVAVNRGTASKNPRSTVATTTEIHDLLRVIYARAGEHQCATCGVSLHAESPTQAAQALADSGWSSGWLTTQTIASDDAANLRAAGFSRLWWKGKELSLDHTDAAKALKQGGQLVIDRFTPSKKAQNRIAEAFTTAYRRGGGIAVFTGKDGNTRTFMARAECHIHGPLFEAKPTPRHFSFNSRMGACPRCEGVGTLNDKRICPQCHGARLNAAARSVSLGGVYLHEFTAQTIQEAGRLLQTLKLSTTQQQITEIPLQKLAAKLDFLERVGVGYISLDRSARSLSSGEAQRMRLATLLGVGLTGVNYVLDEPTTGLHSQDTARLMQILFGLRDMGNTLLVVEHDLETIKRADNVIDVGPGAGVNGGHIVATGSPNALLSNTESVTGAWLAGDKTLPAPSPPTKPLGSVTLRDPTLNNLRTGPITFPTGQWIAVTGVSGAGKSSLVFQTLAPELEANTVKRIKNTPDRVVLINSAPIGGTPRSTPATSAKLLDHIRALFAATPLARQRGYKATRFSFNAKPGRCATCEGRGAILVPMHFLPDVWNNCHDCDGARFNPETLAIRYNGRNISEVLGMRVDEARLFFDAHRGLSKKLQALIDVGLGYITLGQPGNTLSAGEGQRLRLARELASRKGHCAYLLDEPTSGLHMADIAMLTRVLQRLVEAGHTVIMVEHHRELIQRVDHIIDLGPGGGENGGRLIGQGTPQHISTLETPTGLALRRT